MIFYSKIKEKKMGFYKNLLNLMKIIIVIKKNYTPNNK
jgi:hypothetical protein